MKSLHLYIALYLFASNLAVQAKDKNPFVSEIKSHIHSDNNLSKEFKNFTREFGNPVWSQALEIEFEQTIIVLAPIIDYANDFANGVLLFIVHEDNKIDHMFISREQLFKQYIGKKKNKKSKYTEDLIGTFLKFDLKLYNIIEQKLTQAIGFQNGNKEREIKNFEIDNTIVALFDD